MLEGNAIDLTAFKVSRPYCCRGVACLRRVPSTFHTWTLLFDSFSRLTTQSTAYCALRRPPFRLCNSLRTGRRDSVLIRISKSMLCTFQHALTAIVSYEVFVRPRAGCLDKIGVESRYIPRTRAPCSCIWCGVDLKPPSQEIRMAIVLKTKFPPPKCVCTLSAWH